MKKLINFPNNNTTFRFFWPSMQCFFQYAYPAFSCNMVEKCIFMADECRCFIRSKNKSRSRTWRIKDVYTLHHISLCRTIFDIISCYFTCCQVTTFNKSHTLGYTNGYAMHKRPTVGPGGVPLPYNQLSEQELDELAAYNPVLTYGQAKQAPPEEFVPAYVAFDKKVCITVTVIVYVICNCL